MVVGGRSQGTLHKRSPGKLSGAKVRAGGALASHVEPKWCELGVFWGVLHLYHLGEMAGAIVNASRGGLVCFKQGATLVGQLGLVWAWGSLR